MITLSKVQVAIAISTYNGEKFISEQLESIFSQCMPEGIELTVFVRDDGSADGTPRILEKYEKEKLLYISNTDALTGCLNRHAYETDINKLDLKKEWIYISLDLNSLKHVNDTYGHAAGDEMICAAATCMMASFGEFGRVYRIGGDEFAVIITQKPDELDAMTKHFDSSVAEWRGKIVDSMTISYGCVRSLEEDWEFVHDIAKEADRRMYASKARYYSDSDIDRRK